MSVRRLNHAVLYVSDAERIAGFYIAHLGFETAHAMAGAVFLRAAGSPNDHDLGLFSIGAASANGPGPRLGLYHLAWQVETIDDLAAMRPGLLGAGALVGESDHGVSKSLYARDPDGNEFEVMWAVPRADWPTGVTTTRLDLDGARARWSGVATVGEGFPAPPQRGASPRR